MTECAECLDILGMVETAQRLGSRPHRQHQRDTRYDNVRAALSERFAAHQRGEHSSPRADK